MMWLIAKREFRTRTLSKANIVSGSIIVVLIVAAALIGKPFLTDTESEPDVVSVAHDTQEMVPYLESAAEAQGLDLVFAPELTPPVDELPEGIRGFIVGVPHSPEVMLESEDSELIQVITAAAQAAALDAQVTELGGDPTAVSQALAQAVPQVTMLGDQDEFSPGAFFSGFLVMMVLFVVLIQSSSVIMMGVVEEKTSRVVEILLATVRPAVLLGGKILGVGMYALVQSLQMMVPLVFAAWYLDLLDMFDVSIGALLVNFGVWFVLGFALFTILFGGLAALVSRQEDIGSVSTPMILLMMVPLYLAIYLVPSSPDGQATQILTQVPFFAPFMVPMRTAFGGITLGETILAAALCLIAIPLLTWLAGRIYSGAVLNTGGRVKIGDALKRG